MMITLMPQRRDDSLTVFKVGDRLTINGAGFDFSGLPDGAIVDGQDVPCDWITTPVRRIDGRLHVSLVLPVPAGVGDVPMMDPIINPPDGALSLPVFATGASDVDA